MSFDLKWRPSDHGRLWPGADLQVIRWLIGCRQDCLYIRIQSRNGDWETVFLAFLNHLYWNVGGDILLLNLFFKPWRLFWGGAAPDHVLSKPRVPALMTSVSMACSSVLLWLIYSSSQSWTWTWGTNYCNHPTPTPEWLYKKHLVYFSFSGLIFGVQVCHMTQNMKNEKERRPSARFCPYI